MPARIATLMPSSAGGCEDPLATENADREGDVCMSTLPDMTQQEVAEGDSALQDLPRITNPVTCPTGAQELCGNLSCPHPVNFRC